MVEVSCREGLVRRPGRLAIGDGPDGGLLHPMCPRPMQCIAVWWIGWRQLVPARFGATCCETLPLTQPTKRQTVGQDADQLTHDRWLAFQSISNASEIFSSILSANSPHLFGTPLASSPLADKISQIGPHFYLKDTLSSTYPRQPTCSSKCN